MMQNRYIKRILDIIISLIALIIFLPLFLIIAITVRIKLGKPVIFKQQRPGLDGKVFTMYKFRSMNSARNVKGDLLPDKMRITKFGKRLRASSLDELPEFWNILKGDMSLVGPRPLLVKYLSLYSEEQKKRHDVRPGLTGWAQINGRNNMSWDEKLRLDVWYVEHWNLYLDFKILWLTLFKVIKKEGITSEGEVTTDEFKGTKEE